MDRRGSMDRRRSSGRRRVPDNQKLSDIRYPYTTSEAERARRRTQRIAARKRRERARRRKLLRRLMPLLLAAVVVIVVLLVLLIRGILGGKAPAGLAKSTSATRGMVHVLPQQPDSALFSAAPNDATVQIPADDIVSSYAVLIDVEKGVVLAEKDAYTAVSPASMTKILTVLVAAEHVTDLDATFTVTQEITDYAFVNGCTSAGFLPGEAVPIRDLFYGTILPSGADAALALAIYVAGSHEAFVDMMNEKARALGLSEDAHFSNCVGIYDAGNVCSMYDMARILKAAMDNDLCREVLSTKVYEIPASDLHPEGITLSNWFIRKIEDHLTGGFQVLGAKTGYVNQAGSCAASCGQSPDGRVYICVTAKAGSSWSAIYDHAALYKKYAGGGTASGGGEGTQGE